GNLFGRWQTGSGRPLLVGSHLDTVPAGGRLDGALGVVAAVHAVRLLQEEGFEPERPLWVVAFMDEEGTRFNAALFGSRAFGGEMPWSPRDGSRSSSATSPGHERA